MCKQEKIDFIDLVESHLKVFCPQMMTEVRFWVACQFALESNFGNSRLAKVKHNYCGMKIPKSRLTLNLCSVGEFAEFESLEACVLDYVFWLSWNHFNYQHLFNLDFYTRHLIACKYCPDADYIDRVYTLYYSLK